MSVTRLRLPLRLLPFACLPWTLQAAEAPRFGNDVLPILSANCYACHGPDESNRKAKLRFDEEANAKAEHKDGIPIVPGKPDDSMLLERIESTDPDEVMPPPKSHKLLKPEERAILKRWIEQGAKWGRHWSFEPLTRPPVPAAEAGAHPIDAFIDAALKNKGLSASREASPQTLVRRLSLDLIGLPPTPEAADAFAANPSEAGYERLVDDLLARPQFGEHWARMWLDLARYADTKGYEKDLGRTMWPYRDWVVRAFNEDMPLDRFTEKQLAGDLLPGATEQDLIATAFHRNTMTNEEGGIDPEEFRVVAVKDRVDTTVQVWMGLTMGCAKCHSHKYDPISQTDYYSFFAIFNETEDANRGNESPTLPVSADPAQRSKLESQVKSLEAAVKERAAAEEGAARSNPMWHPVTVRSATSQGGAKLAELPDHSIQASGTAPDKDTYAVEVTLPPGSYTGFRLEALPNPLANGQRGVGRSERDPNFVLSEFTAEALPANQATRSLAFSAPKADFEQKGWPAIAAVDGKPETGWAISPRKDERHAILFPLAESLRIESETTVRFRLSQQYGNALTLAKFRLTVTSEPAGKLGLDNDSPEVSSLRRDLTAAQDALRKFDENLPKLPILRELPADRQRVTKLQRRGNFLDPGDVVHPGVPAGFGAFPAGGGANRLAVAHWLVSAENPLTPRVWANRIWARIFGAGLVETEEDFGALGSKPVNPALLDWLAAEYRDNGWSLKKLLKTIVMSRTYRRDSAATPALLAADPQNLFLERGARFRLSAEAVRDQALAAGGLLSLKMGGPPVMPPQPDGLWRSTYSGQKWVNAEGEDRWRRGLYTYWKRTSPYPSLTAFDAGSREVCQIRRISTNTPLQALVTLNDPVYLEAAAGLASRMCADCTDAPSRAARGLRLALVRPLHASETEPLLQLQRDAQAAFASAPGKAGELLQQARWSADRRHGLSSEQAASWLMVASAILNLDEFLSRN